MMRRADWEDTLCWCWNKLNKGVVETEGYGYKISG